jgi:hypothetical protein
MTGQRTQPPLNAFGILQRFARRPGVNDNERCELCGNAVAPEHEHLLEVDKRRLVCACQACAILFSGQAGQRFKRVPSRVRTLPDFQLTDSQWEELLVPINMAFFFQQSASGKVIAMYPSPAGATESQLPLESWQQIASENPALQLMEADVEALLVNRLGEQRGFPVHQYFLLPIDQCFKLVGLVRTHWRGFSGGSELWQELARFFAMLDGRHA